MLLLELLSEQRDNGVWLSQLVCHFPANQSCTYDCPAILVGNARDWLPELIERAKSLKVTGGFEEGADL